MDNLFRIVATLFLITAVLHLAYPILYGVNESTTPVAIFGVIYLILGIVFFRNGGQGYLKAIGFSLTAIGFLGATSIYISNDAPLPLDLTLIIIDVFILGILLYLLLKKQKPT